MWQSKIDFVRCVLGFVTMRSPHDLLIHSYNEQGVQKKKKPREIKVSSLMVETKRIELSTLRMRTVRSPS